MTTNNKNYYLWLDDLRDPFTKPWSDQVPANIDIVWAKSYIDFVNTIDRKGLPETIDFDHDLGLEYDTNGVELNGYECAKYVCEYCLDNDITTPPNFVIHSSNPVGRENILSLYKTFQKINGR